MSAVRDAQELRDLLAVVAVVVSVAGALPACGPQRVVIPCMPMGAPSALVTEAAAFRVDVYGAGARCDGARVAAGASGPSLTQTFLAGVPIELLVAPGSYVVGLTAFADVAATRPIAASCSAEELQPGESLCVSADVVAVDGGSDLATGTDASCQVAATDAGLGCWDVSAVFSRTDFPVVPTALSIFGRQVVDGETVHAFLDAQDASYATTTTQCSFGGPRMTPEAWFIERKTVDSNTYQLLVRGVSEADCGLSRPSCTGQITVNPQSGWRLSQTVRCNVEADNAGLSTYCNVDPAQGTISWQSGSSCGGAVPDCCACSDGARVDIEVVVSR